MGTSRGRTDTLTGHVPRDRVLSSEVLSFIPPGCFSLVNNSCILQLSKGYVFVSAVSHTYVLMFFACNPSIPDHLEWSTMFLCTCSRSTFFRCRMLIPAHG